MATKSVAIVGVGISGLSCATTLAREAQRTSRKLNLRLFEASNRIGGQIDTRRLMIHGLDSRVIVEAGAEGFVARSKIFPELAEMSCMDTDQIVKQSRVADNELQVNPGDPSRFTIVELEPGLAAQKLGFQVPEEDRGKGLRSFKNGMGDIIEQLANGLDISLNSSVSSVESVHDGFRLGVFQNGILSSYTADLIVFATPLAVIKETLKSYGVQCNVKPLLHNSHVSVHLLVRRREGISPTSFTVSLALQEKFGGLRACSFLDDKFPGRCDDNHWLFRFYFRPSPDEMLSESEKWVVLARETLERVFGYSEEPVWYHFAPWQSGLPVITPDHIRDCRTYREELCDKFKGAIEICGSEVSGAGLDAAATSGYDAAKRILEKV